MISDDYDMSDDEDSTGYSCEDADSSLGLESESCSDDDDDDGDDNDDVDDEDADDEDEENEDDDDDDDGDEVDGDSEDEDSEDDDMGDSEVDDMEDNLHEVKEVLDIFDNMLGKEFQDKYSLAQLLGDNDDWEDLDTLRRLIQMRMNAMG